VSENLLFYVYNIALQRSKAIVLIGAFESNGDFVYAIICRKAEDTVRPVNPGKLKGGNYVGFQFAIFQFSVTNLPRWFLLYAIPLRLCRFPG